MQPTRGLFVANNKRTDSSCPLHGLASNGGPKPRKLPHVLVRSYRTVSPLPVSQSCDCAHRRFVLCWTLRQVAPTRLSPALCPVKPRLSSDSGASTITRDHPTYSPSR